MSIEQPKIIDSEQLTPTDNLILDSAFAFFKGGIVKEYRTEDKPFERSELTVLTIENVQPPIFLIVPKNLNDMEVAITDRSDQKNIFMKTDLKSLTDADNPENIYFPNFLAYRQLYIGIQNPKPNIRGKVDDKYIQVITYPRFNEYNTNMYNYPIPVVTEAGIPINNQDNAELKYLVVFACCCGSEYKSSTSPNIDIRQAFAIVSNPTDANF